MNEVLAGIEDEVNTLFEHSDLYAWVLYVLTNGSI